ncbi:hypothetical protein F5146DRAFT_1004236 [Armillaria mellea]|nr:hypothetical protein F5146DRAFT_1004236 [Armillaria mellea]
MVTDMASPHIFKVIKPYESCGGCRLSSMLMRGGMGGSEQGPGACLTDWWEMLVADIVIVNGSNHLIEFVGTMHGAASLEGLCVAVGGGMVATWGSWGHQLHKKYLKEYNLTDVWWIWDYGSQGVPDSHRRQERHLDNALNTLNAPSRQQERCLDDSKNGTVDTPTPPPLLRPAQLSDMWTCVALIGPSAYYYELYYKHKHVSWLRRRGGFTAFTTNSQDVWECDFSPPH